MAFLTGGGVVLVTASLLSESKEKLAVSEALHERNLRSLDKIDASILKIEQFRHQAEDLDKRLKGLTISASDVQQAIADVEQKNLEISEDLRTAIVSLVSELKENGGTRPPATMDRIENIVESLSQTRTKIVESERRIDLSRYTVMISNFEGADDLAESLSEEGYRAHVYPEPRITHVSSVQAIAIGEDIPVQIASKLVRVAKEKYPFLRYIRFVNHPGDDGWATTLFAIGARTQRAIDNGYRQATEKEFKQIMMGELTQREYHELISSFRGS